MKEFLFWWTICSYAIGLFIFAMEHGSWARIKEPVVRNHTMMIRLVLLFAAPLTTWHAVLHYGQVAWCKITKQKLKFWI
jgi:hypothetical protein